MFSQEGAPHAHQSVLEISNNIEIRRSSLGRIVNDHFRATHAKENSVPICVARILHRGGKLTMRTEAVGFST